MPSERPILFSGPMVRAILADQKTVTRRVMKPQPEPCPRGGHWWRGPAVYQSMIHVEEDINEAGFPGPYGSPGDRLWVRETWQAVEIDGAQLVAFRATCAGDAFDYVDAEGDVRRIEVKRWRPSIFMPRAASRLTLEVASVRAERLHAIDDEDARREGAAWRIAPGGDLAGAFEGIGGPIGYREHFAQLWDTINGDRAPWADDPWVWRVEFRRVEEVTHG